MQNWIKVSEAESLDIVTSWASLTSKPLSSVVQIDNAVAIAHTHSNKTQLDNIGQNVEGLLTYNGSLPTSSWATVNW